MPLWLLVALPFLGSVLAAVLPTRSRTLIGTFAGLIALVVSLALLTAFPMVRDGGVIRQTIHWVPSIGLDLAFRLDGFAWMFALMIAVIGVLVCLYARYYMSPDDPAARFYSMLLAFMGAMLGVVMAGNLLQLVVFWELTSFASFLLIGYWYHRTDAQRGARMALIVTGFGGLCLLAGVILLAHIVGSYQLDVVLASGDRIRSHAWYPATLVLIAVGALTKSAQFPFHFWLPRAMAAPTPVSAYLHSATMVKAGVFVLARFWPVLSGTELWFWLIGGAGAITLLLGAYLAMFQNDLKRVLAYSTVSHLGLITLLFGLNSPLAAVAGVFHIMNHATFKASLFMAAGIVDHETGTRDIRRLSGLIRAMPRTGVLALVATAAMAGVPLLNGFLSKEMFFSETVFLSASPFVESALPVLATVASLFAVVYSLRFGYDIFFGPPSTDLPRTPEEAPRWMRMPIQFLVLACVIVGVAPTFAIGGVLQAAARPVVGGSLPDYSLALWHGLNLPLLMSLIAIVGGIAGYRGLRACQERGRLLVTPFLSHWNGRDVFESLLLGLTRGARDLLAACSTRRLQPQLFVIIAGTVVLALLASRGVALSWGDRPRVPVSNAFVVLWIIGMICAIGAAATAKFHRLVAITLMGGAGLVTCLTFAWFSAPDLALTQIVVEVVTTTLFLLGLRWLPMRIPVPGRRRSLHERARRGRDLLLAAIVGGGLAALSFAFLTRPAPHSISPFFLANALPGGGGSNVVNVMLVDFRAFDTLGEITVLGAVALTVYALLRRFRPPAESIAQPAQQRALPEGQATDLLKPRRGDEFARGYLLVPSVIARWLMPVSLVVAAHYFLRGHNEPGGGFVAGLIVAIALLMQYIVSGTRWVEARTHVRPARWIAMGLLIGATTGLGAVLLGYPFLTSHTAHVTWPMVGEVHLPSAALFDLAVLGVVVGSTLLILTALAHQSIRKQAPAPHPINPEER
ncbi:MAG TPA: monovalent cation/H+ antiporter subunit A [Lysobacter sp.]|nr:monovalent cation/H+ antiporter subunit A [Lysobacter sp.]HZX78211.1 monovalent cation/H+ antiporter subunit A [Lysobacter sp.]